jgi:hypothetical protein
MAQKRKPDLSIAEAAMAVLKGRTKPMSVQEITDTILERGLAKGLTGLTPAATVGSILATRSKAGRDFRRVAPGQYLARKGG